MSEKFSFIVKLPLATEHQSDQTESPHAHWVKIDAMLKPGKRYRVTIEELPEETSPAPVG